MLADTIALLARTPGALNALLRNLPDPWTNHDEGPGTWSAQEVIGHLIFGEKTDWIPRARIILEYGDSRPFDPFDRAPQTGGKSLAELLDEFAELRAKNLDALRVMTLRPQDLQRRGKHPALGIVTLSELLGAWAAHDLTHLHQISRVMAHQYRNEIGPWARFMGVYACNGHSE